MSKMKLSNIELDQLVRDGFGVSEIARKLGVSKGAVSKRLKALKVAITQNVALHHAGEIVEKKLDAIEPAAEDKRLRQRAPGPPDEMESRR